MKYTLLKTKLEHEIEQHFEDDVYYHVSEQKNTFPLYFEIKENGRTYIIEGVYHYSEQIYKKEEIKCYQSINGNLLPVELSIRIVNNNPNKITLLECMDAMVEHEEKKQKERSLESMKLNRI